MGCDLLVLFVCGRLERLTCELGSPAHRAPAISGMAKKTQKNSLSSAATAAPTMPAPTIATSYTFSADAAVQSALCAPCTAREAASIAVCVRQSLALCLAASVLLSGSLAPVFARVLVWITAPQCCASGARVKEPFIFFWRRRRRRVLRVALVAFDAAARAAQAQSNRKSALQRHTNAHTRGATLAPSAHARATRKKSKYKSKANASSRTIKGCWGGRR